MFTGNPLKGDGLSACPAATSLLFEEGFLETGKLPGRAILHGKLRVWMKMLHYFFLPGDAHHRRRWMRRPKANRLEIFSSDHELTPFALTWTGIHSMRYSGAKRMRTEVPFCNKMCWNVRWGWESLCRRRKNSGMTTASAQFRLFSSLFW